MNAPAVRFTQHPPAPEAFLPKDDAWHQASIARTLRHWDGQSDLWIFGYGSLIWRPEFDYLESRMARIHGYHRALCLWSRINRGTPQQPGLVFALDRGGSCDGKVFRIAGPRVPDIMQALWRREMPGASYIPRWLNCRTGSGTIPGLVFTMDRADAAYAPRLPTEQIVTIVRQGHGRYGPCTEYVLQTARALEDVGITDRKLRQIALALQLPLTPHP